MGCEVALFLPLPLEEVEVADEAVEEALVLVAERPQQDEQRQAALAGHAGPGGDVLGGLGLHVELDPLPPVGVDGPRHDDLGVAAGLEDDARGAHQLAHHHPLGAVDDEGALVRHHREVPHEDGLLLDLPGLGVHEPRPDEHRGGEGHVLLLALLLGELGRRVQVGVGRVVLELEAQLPGEVLDGTDVGEGLGQSFVQEPAERVSLDGDEVRQTQDLVEVGERKTIRALRPCRQRSTPPSGWRAMDEAAMRREVPSGRGRSDEGWAGDDGVLRGSDGDGYSLFQRHRGARQPAGQAGMARRKGHGNRTAYARPRSKATPDCCHRTGYGGPGVPSSTLGPRPRPAI